MTKQYKDILIPYASTVDLIDTGSKLYCLSSPTVHMILSISESFYWFTRWTKEANEIEAFTSIQRETIKELASILEWELMNPCENCPSPEEINEQVIMQTGILQAMQRDSIVSRYDGSTIESINVNAPTDYYDGDGSTARTAALCTAVKNYLTGYYAQLGVRVGLAGGLSVIEALGGVAIMLGSAVFPPLGAIGAIAFAHGLSQVAIAADFLEAINDESAVNSVICCMFSALQGLAVTEANFEASLSGCNFTEGTNEFILANLAGSDLVDQGNWIMFVDCLGRAYLAAQAGLQDCPCCDAGSILLTFDDSLGYTLPATGGAGVSTIDNTVGNALPSVKSWFGTLSGYPSYYATVRVLLPCVTSVSHIDYDYRHNNNQGDNALTRIARFYSSNGVLLHQEFVSDSKTRNVWHNQSWAVSVPNVAYIDCVVARQSTGQTGSSWIDNIAVDYG